MLLVTFHGGSGGINNVYAYNTTTNALVTQTAITGESADKLSELRAITYANSLLYVAVGKKSLSRVVCCQPQGAANPYEFLSLGHYVEASFDTSNNFKTSISHPYALQFDGAGYSYISNQDTNVVARAQVSADWQKGLIGTGCQSIYLKNQTSFCPRAGCVYLDGTFAGSQTGNLPGVSVTASDVPAQYGGLAVSIDSGKVQNSVRDLAIVGGVLYVCDEPAKVLRLYALPSGTYLGASAAFSHSPTHLSVQDGGLYASAGSKLYWSALPAAPGPLGLSFQEVLEVPTSFPAETKIGGISFNTGSPSLTAYVAFQTGTGTTGTGAIYTYTVTAGAPPVLSDDAVFASGLTDTPEFLLYLPDAI